MMKVFSFNIAFTCSICLDNAEQALKILQCEHKFHRKCIKDWFETGSESLGLLVPSCPMCRQESTLTPEVADFEVVSGEDQLLRYFAGFAVSS